MSDSDWKQRFEAAIEASGKSRRAISLAAGMGPGYVHSVLREGKEPTIGSLIAICREAGVSAAHILLGLDISAQDEEILTLFAQVPEDQRPMVLAIIRNFSSSKERISPAPQPHEL